MLKRYLPGFDQECIDAIRAAMRLGASDLRLWGRGGDYGAIMVSLDHGLLKREVRFDDEPSLACLRAWVLDDLVPHVHNISNVSGCHDGYHDELGSDVRIDAEVLYFIRKRV